MRQLLCLAVTAQKKRPPKQPYYLNSTAVKNSASDSIPVSKKFGNGEYHPSSVTSGDARSFSGPVASQQEVKVHPSRRNANMSKKKSKRSHSKPASTLVPTPLLQRAVGIHANLQNDTAMTQKQPAALQQILISPTATCSTTPRSLRCNTVAAKRSKHTKPPDSATIIVQTVAKCCSRSDFSGSSSGVSCCDCSKSTTDSSSSISSLSSSLSSTSSTCEKLVKAKQQQKFPRLTTDPLQQKVLRSSVRSLRSSISNILHTSGAPSESLPCSSNPAAACAPSPFALPRYMRSPDPSSLPNACGLRWRRGSPVKDN